MCHVAIGWWPLIASHHLVKFSSHRPYESGNTFFICHVNSQDHMIERTFDFVVLAPYHTPPSCQVWWPQVSWRWNFLFVMWPDVSTWSVDYVTLWITSFYQKLPLCQVFFSHRSYGSGDITFFICHIITWTHV